MSFSPSRAQPRPPLPHHFLSIRRNLRAGVEIFYLLWIWLFMVVVVNGNLSMIGLFILTTISQCALLGRFRAKDPLAKAMPAAHYREQLQKAKMGGADMCMECHCWHEEGSGSNRHTVTTRRAVEKMDIGVVVDESDQISQTLERVPLAKVVFFLKTETDPSTVGPLDIQRELMKKEHTGVDRNMVRTDTSRATGGGFGLGDPRRGYRCSVGRHHCPAHLALSLTDVLGVVRARPG